MIDETSFDPGAFLTLCASSGHVPIDGFSLVNARFSWLRVRLCERCGLLYAEKRETNPDKIPNDQTKG